MKIDLNCNCKFLIRKYLLLSIAVTLLLFSSLIQIQAKEYEKIRKNNENIKYTKNSISSISTKNLFLVDVSRQSINMEGLVKFTKEVLTKHGKTEYNPPQACNSNIIKNCRNLFEVITIAYEKIKDSVRVFSFESCAKDLNSKECNEESRLLRNKKSIYYISSELDLKENKLSKFVFGIIPYKNTKYNYFEQGEAMLVKICISSNTMKREYIDVVCSNSPCNEEFDLADEEKDCNEMKYISSY